jgi:PAS domain S-box-containing protein
MKPIIYKSLFQYYALAALMLLFGIGLMAADKTDQPIKVKGDQYYPPFEFVNDKGEPDGFNVELFKKIAEDLSLEYTLELGNWVEVRKELENQEIDLLLGVLKSDKRAEKFTYGLPFSMMTYDIFTRKNETYNNLQALEGKRVVVQRGDYMHDFLQEAGLTAQLILANDQFEALQLIQQGLYDAAVLGSFQAAHLINEYELDNIKPQLAEMQAVPYAMAASKGTDTLIWMLNAALYNLKENGTYDQLYNKWFAVYERKDFFDDNLGWFVGLVAFVLVLIAFLILLRNRVAIVTKYLKASKEQYQILIQNQEDFILKLSPNGIVLFASPSFCRLLDKSEKELYHLSIDQIFDKQFAEIFRKKITDLTLGVSDVETELQIRLNDKFYWINWRFTGLKYGKTQLREVLVVGRDVTKNKIYKLELEASENRFSQVLETIPNIAVQGYREDGTVRYWNSASEVIYGYSKAEAFGRTLFELIIPENIVEGVRKDVAKMLQEGKGLASEELELKRKDGSLIKVFSSHTVVSLPNGQRELYCVDIDLSEIKRAQLIQQVLFNITNAVHINSNIEELIGIIHHELSKLMDCSNLFIAFYDAEKDEFSTFDKNDAVENIPVWPAEGSLSGLVVRRRKSLLVTSSEFKKMEQQGLVNLVGKPAAVWLGVPLIAGDEVLGAVVVQSFEHSDAYDQRTVNLMEFVSRQISLAIQRQRNLLNLIEAKRKAEQSDQLKSAFLNNLSHEIRTPLNGIVGLATMFDSDETTSEERREFGDLIIDNSQQLTNIIDDIVHMSAIETAQVDLYYSDINLYPVLDETVGLFMLRNQNGEVEMLSDFPAEANIPIVRTDEGKIRKIVSVLLDNALKYTEKGKVKLSWSITGAQLQIAVEDTGIGIDPSDHEKIFERFQKIENQNKKLYRGNGLGLSIARAYARLLGGDISVSSELNKGAVFKVHLPVNITSIPPKLKSMNGNTSKMHKIKVLIVEDEFSNLHFIKSSLKDHIFEITTAGNGKDAVTIFEQNPDFDLILMDLKLPLLSGYDATRKIKAIKQNVPVIAITAYALRGDKEKALEAGCDAYLAKPFIKEELLTIIDRFVALPN